MAAWGYYESACKPNEWYTLYPIAANGKQQSPIDLQREIAVKTDYPKLEMDYLGSEVKSAGNNGHSVTFTLTGGNSVLSGGPLTGKYTLLQFHFHWGSDNSKGSEHFLDGKQYSAEMHLVHMNQKYSTFSEAIAQKDGLCVVGVLIEVGDETKPAFQSVVDVVKNAQYNGDTATVNGGIDINKLLPQSGDYIHYIGSLTTPTLNECVDWINMTEPVRISEEQIAVYRGLYHTAKGEANPIQLVNNFRPCQGLNDRKLNLHSRGGPGGPGGRGGHRGSH